MDINLENFKRVHFIGIGGISMSGLAHILLNNGHIVTGSDIKKFSYNRKVKTRRSSYNNTSQ